MVLRGGETGAEWHRKTHLCAICASCANRRKGSQSAREGTTNDTNHANEFGTGERQGAGSKSERSEVKVRSDAREQDMVSSFVIRPCGGE